MVKEVIDRVNLTVNVQGSRKISRENLQFMFEKYELSKEQREEVLNYCTENHILVFNEGGAPAAERIEVGNAKVVEEEKKAKNTEKKSFFGRLFGR